MFRLKTSTLITSIFMLILASCAYIEIAAAQSSRGQERDREYWEKRDTADQLQRERDRIREQKEKIDKSKSSKSAQAREMDDLKLLLQLTDKFLEIEQQIQADKNRLDHTDRGIEYLRQRELDVLEKIRKANDKVKRRHKIQINGYDVDIKDYVDNLIAIYKYGFFMDQISPCDPLLSVLMQDKYRHFRRSYETEAYLIKRRTARGAFYKSCSGDQEVFIKERQKEYEARMLPIWQDERFRTLVVSHADRSVSGHITSISVASSETQSKFVEIYKYDKRTFEGLNGVSQWDFEFLMPKRFGSKVCKFSFIFNFPDGNKVRLNDLEFCQIRKVGKIVWWEANFPTQQFHVYRSHILFDRDYRELVNREIQELEDELLRKANEKRKRKK